MRWYKHVFFYSTMEISFKCSTVALSLIKCSNYFCRESAEVFKLERQKLQDQCVCLEAKLLEKEEKLQLQKEEYHKKDAIRVQNIEELKAVASHWMEKWEKVALTLQSTQEELEDLKKSNSKNEVRLFPLSAMGRMILIYSLHLQLLINFSFI